MCRKYIFEKYAIGIRAIGFRAIGKRPFLQFGESEIRGIHPLRELRSLAVSDPGAKITWQLDLVEAMPLLRSLAVSVFQVKHIN